MRYCLNFSGTLKIRTIQVPDGFRLNSLVIKSSLSGGCSEKGDIY